MSMKDIIKQVLDRHKNGQGNIGSDSFREMLAVEIEAVLLSKDTQGLPYHTNHLADDNSPMYPWHRDESWSVGNFRTVWRAQGGSSQGYSAYRRSTSTTHRDRPRPRSESQYAELS